MALIKKKILTEYFDAVFSGKKTWELRLGDMEVAEGDTLVLQEWNPETKEYTGREISKEVTYVRKFKIDELFWPKEEVMEKGLVIVSIE
ncbi:hypothetical protein A2765_03540 [Candidatus Kaiserbacteria bacterium RIFCSPHIGHO2_01_FULL_56_24]|uniref:DUF3850 domain-containing protein n=1 Tax=Candidatus Kaiserbacteria bacterium RIFCSPHIGHO2_01_FULL_56_24 TaxID=1798487 RepID=A0A1F6DGQ3_9BACT|nr:MAG: hypothetical protein A2765_03540 [Candidatus Kaiserbacteria bacterium RIFCSPHIGHO2_01_FULL_56_24]